MFIKKLYNKSETVDLRKKLRHSMTKDEVLLWKCLKGKQLKWKFRRQHGIGPFSVDFFSYIQFAIEIDGLSHEDEETFRNDQKRQSILKFKTLKSFDLPRKKLLTTLNGSSKTFIINATA